MSNPSDSTADPSLTPADRAGSTRQELILSTLSGSGFRSVADLADVAGVSQMTIRRDLRRLAEVGAVRVVHGGASLPPGTRPVRSGYEARLSANLDRKQALAALAATLVGAEDTIGIDGGTTTHELATALSGGPFRGSVVTASVPVISELAHHDQIHLVGVGGDLYRPSQAFVGPAAVDAIERLRFKTVFLGASAVDERGVYVAADVERPTKLALMAGADRVVLLVDATKLTTSAPVRLCAWSSIDTLVTDATLPEEISRTVQAAGVDVRVP